MNKIKFSVTQNGSPLDSSKYSWNESAKTFSTNEDNLVLDFSNIEGVTFKTSYNCTFDTGSYCIFKTSSYCTFNTGYNCTFDTGSDCTFDTGSYCTFKTGSDCIFKTSYNCTFDKTGSNCVVVRRDIFEVIQLGENQKIKLNAFNIKGFTIIEDKPSLSGKEISVTIDGQTYSAIVK